MANENVRSVIGRVVSDKMDKTLVIVLDRMVKHKLYKKYIMRSTKVYAHDEDNNAHMGDVVKIQMTRPRSKTKCWELVEILERAQQV